MEKKLIPVRESLDAKMREAMDVLHIPRGNNEKQLKVREDFKDIEWVTQGYLFGSLINPMWEKCPRGERGHSSRVSMYGMGVSKLLGFDDDARAYKFIADGVHDKGKLVSMHLYPKPNMPQEERKASIEQFKRAHVALDAVCTEFGQDMASIAHQSHRHQRVYFDPYPDNLQLPVSPLNFTLSQLLAIQDCFDSRASRPCCHTQEIHSEGKTRELLLGEYGKMKIKYDGPLLPRMDMTGGDLICKLYEKDVFGKQMPENFAKDIPQVARETYFRMNPFIETRIE